MLLAGDIGGTKTNLAIFSVEKGWREPLVEATFPSARYSSLENLVGDFLAQYNFSIERASFGVAGPVVAGRAAITNLPWVLEETSLKEALHISAVHLLNDLGAIAHAIPHLEARDIYTLNKGESLSGGAIGVIAPGTGLGEAFLLWDGSRYLTQNSEGGHADFAPSDEFQLEMLRYLQRRYNHVSYERVCSGKGLPNIYNYLKESGYAKEPSWLTEKLATAEDITPIIVNAALATEESCEICVATLKTFVSILGAEAGNLALKVLATGGIYIGGGIPPRILSLLDTDDFMQAFLRKGRLADLLAPIPVHVILNPKIALLGAAAYGFEMMEKI